eukprot:6209454-Amphidinium_carterae.2
MRSAVSVLSANAKWRCSLRFRNFWRLEETTSSEAMEEMSADGCAIANIRCPLHVSQLAMMCWQCLHKLCDKRRCERSLVLGAESWDFLGNGDDAEVADVRKILIAIRHQYDVAHHDAEKKEVLWARPCAIL